MEVEIYDTKNRLAEEFADFFCNFVKERTEIHVALSGGSTPKIVFDVLAEKYTKKIDWHKIHLYWGDERCVPPDDSESNYKMTKEHLLSKVDLPESNIHRIKGENDPDEEALAYAELLDKNLTRKNKLPQFDLLILGMGDDGHTASIFPHQIALWHSDRYCEVAQHPETGQQRISLSGKLINNAEHVAFLVTGEAKAEKLREIVTKEGPWETYPASLVDPDSGNLIWFLDLGAASKLDPTE